jgi:lysine-specific demethylase 8
MKIILTYLFILVLVLHADYIGLQSGPQKGIDVVDGFIVPEQFFNKFVIPGKPVLFRGAARTFPAFTKWTDQYFKSLPDSETFSVFVEEGKKENRDDGSRQLTFLEFLKAYKEEDIYYVNPVPEFLASDIPLHLPLSCPFIIENLLADNVMWFSSGGTKSVWHMDAYENINCLMRGKKWFIMANRSETHQKAHIDVREGSYSSVDVENVDTDKYPGFKDMQFFNVTMEAGDCLYIPWLWFHHVTSFGR